MMTNNEIVDLLTAITAYDNRNAGPANVLAWAKAAELGRWTYTEALEAVFAHFAEDTAYLMPAHVTARIKRERQDQAMRRQQAELEAAPADPAAAERILQICNEVATKMGWSEDGQDRGGFALRVQCPACGAALGVRCVSTATGKVLSKSPCHPSRAEALADTFRGKAS